MHAWTQMMWPLAFEQAKLWGPRVVHATISESINFRILTYIYDRYLALYIIYLFICMRKQVWKGASLVCKRSLIYLLDSHQHLPSSKPLIPNLYPYIWCFMCKNMLNNIIETHLDWVLGILINKPCSVNLYIFLNEWWKPITPDVAWGSTIELRAGTAGPRGHAHINIHISICFYFHTYSRFVVPKIRWPPWKRIKCLAHI